ncbi:MAG TPA: histidinol-phosphate transaminase [Candidatus Limnocylindrales bacterium]
MSPTPVSMAVPTAPSGYVWEATTEQVAARYGVPVERIVRFDLNTAAEPPGIALAALATGAFEGGLSEYPPSDYRRLVAAAARRYGVAPYELLVGAGADEVLDIIAKAFLPPGGAAVVPTPSYAMFRVLTDQRGARIVAVPRLGPDRGFAIDAPAVRAAGADASVIWLCSPNNPTGLPEPDRAIATLLHGLRTDAAADGRQAPIVVLDEAYAEFVGTSLVGLRDRYPGLIVVRTVSKAYGLAGLRVGFAIATSEVIAAMEPYRPPGSLSTVSVAVATAAFEDGDWLAPRVAAANAERERLATALVAAGWAPHASVANFLLLPCGSPARAQAVADALLRRGLVPRTFGAGHPLVDHLRLTVRSPEQDDRLIEALGVISTDSRAKAGAAPERSAQGSRAKAPR